MPQGSFDLWQNKICLDSDMSQKSLLGLHAWPQIASKTLVGFDKVVTFVTAFVSKWIQANSLIGLFTHGCQKLAKVSELKNVMLQWHEGYGGEICHIKFHEIIDKNVCRS